jgi:hypothetical protein
MRRIEARVERSITELKDQIEAHHEANVLRLEALNKEVNQGLGVLATTKFFFNLLWALGGALVGFLATRLTSK